MRYIFLTAALIFSAGNLFAANTVDMMFGDVKSQSQGSNLWQKVSQGQTVRLGDTILTGVQSFAVIDTGGNKIKVQPNTKVKFTQDMINDRQQSSLSLFSGSVNCKMDKLKKGNSSFSVNTASSVCAVRGTEFDVASGADGNTVLQVTDGLVALSGMTKSVDVGKDQESSVKIGGEPEPVKIVKRQDWEKWANEAGNDVKGKEKDIMEGCLAKTEKLDSDITQLENERAAAKKRSDDLKIQAEEAKKAGDKDRAMKLAVDAERSRVISASLNNKAFYQASRIELVKGVADNAYNSSEDKATVQKSYDRINSIYDKYFIKYIKPILDSEKLRQEIRDKKKLKNRNK